MRMVQTSDESPSSELLPVDEANEQNTKSSPPCIPMERKRSTASEEGADNADEAAEESAEKESVGGKKKGTRKKRSLNWEEAERGLLLEVIKPKVEFVENRSVDAKNIKSKRLAWTYITKQFNALNFRHRLLEQIQVQWRSMKNSAKREYQQKHPKSDNLDGTRMIEFMEEMQKEVTVTARSQTRNSGSSVIKKELLDMDEDEDMPLAALPNSTNASEDTLQTSTIAIPSPPPSTAEGDSQQESCQQATPPRRKRVKVNDSNKNKEDIDVTINTESTDVLRKRRVRKLSQLNSTSDDAAGEVPPLQLSLPALSDASNGDIDVKMKQDLFKIMKQARLAQMDYVRREHEQKLRFGQMEQELKLKYYRQEQDLKLRILSEEHELRMRQHKIEHEARLGAYTCRMPRSNALKQHNNEDSMTPPPTQDVTQPIAATVLSAHN